MFIYMAAILSSDRLMTWIWLPTKVNSARSRYRENCLIKNWKWLKFPFFYLLELLLEWQVSGTKLQWFKSLKRLHNFQMYYRNFLKQNYRCLLYNFFYIFWYTNSSVGLCRCNYCENGPVSSQVISWTSRASRQTKSNLSYAKFTLGCSLSTF